MANLTIFVLAHTLPGDISIEQLLDFFESAPRLRNIELIDATPTSGAKDQRLVSLASLNKMEILRSRPCSSLLDCLLIPAGAKLKIQALFSAGLEDHLPRSLENLRNLYDFTKINLFFSGAHPGVQFTGPNGQVSVYPATPQINSTWLLLGQLDTSRTKRLRIFGDHLPLRPSDAIYPDLLPMTSDPPDAVYLVLLPMTDLRTLTVSGKNLDTIIYSLSPRQKPSSVVVCPRLEELVLYPCGGREPFMIWGMVHMVTARAARGAKLECVRIVSRDPRMQKRVLELAKHVSRVECIPEVDAASDDSDGED